MGEGGGGRGGERREGRNGVRKGGRGSEDYLIYYNPF